MLREKSLLGTENVFATQIELCESTGTDRGLLWQDEDEVSDERIDCRLFGPRASTSFRYDIVGVCGLSGEDRMSRSNGRGR